MGTGTTAESAKNVFVSLRAENGIGGGVEIGARTALGFMTTTVAVTTIGAKMGSSSKGEAAVVSVAIIIAVTTPTPAVCLCTRKLRTSERASERRA